MYSTLKCPKRQIKKKTKNLVTKLWAALMEMIKGWRRVLKNQ